MKVESLLIIIIGLISLGKARISDDPGGRESLEFLFFLLYGLVAFLYGNYLFFSS